MYCGLCVKNPFNFIRSHCVTNAIYINGFKALLIFTNDNLQEYLFK